MEAVLFKYQKSVLLATSLSKLTIKDIKLVLKNTKSASFLFSISFHFEKYKLCNSIFRFYFVCYSTPLLLGDFVKNNLLEPITNMSAFSKKRIQLMIRQSDMSQKCSKPLCVHIVKQIIYFCSWLLWKYSILILHHLIFSALRTNRLLFFFSPGGVDQSRRYCNTGPIRGKGGASP